MGSEESGAPQTSDREGFEGMAEHRNPAFAQRLREVRGEKTQAEFARQLRVSLRTVQSWEAGKQPRDAMVAWIARTNKVPLSWLLGVDLEEGENGAAAC